MDKNVIEEWKRRRIEEGKNPRARPEHPTRLKLIRAIEEGRVTPDMGYRQIGRQIGVDHPQQVKWHLLKLLREVDGGETEETKGK